MNIGAVFRKPNLPYSVSPGRTATVQITIDPPLDGQCPTFEIVVLSKECGTAAIVGNPRLSASGEIEVRGGQQTVPGHAGGLRIRAILNGMPVAESLPFSVCAHPDAIAYDYIGNVNDDPKFFGVLLRANVVSDSGHHDDLNEVLEKEIVSADFGHSGALHGHPAEIPEQDRQFHSALTALQDRHTVAIVTTHAKDCYRLHGAEGGWSNDQLDVFICRRCGIVEPGVSIRRSGYRLTRTMFTEGGQLKMRFRKEGLATNVGGFQSEPGISPAIERILDVPALHDPLPPLDNQEG